jgi:hypothetical protein
VPWSPLLLLHVCAGTAGLLSGAVTMSLRKGSRQHRIAGNVFFISMLSMAAAGAYMAFMKSQITNIFGGVLTLYLVATAWVTARRRDGTPGIFDYAALLIALALGTSIVTFGLEAANSPSGSKDGIPAGMFFMLGSVALLCAAGDIRMLVRGGLSGTSRIARHLWRMCFAWFIASASLFLARPHLFPVVLRRTNVIFLAGILPLILMTFWLFRIQRSYFAARIPVTSTKSAI